MLTCFVLAKVSRIHLSEGVEGFDEDRLKVPWASVVSRCKMHLVLPIQRAGEAIVIAIEKMYTSHLVSKICNGVEIYDDRDEGPVRMWT